MLTRLDRHSDETMKHMFYNYITFRKTYRIIRHIHASETDLSGKDKQLQRLKYLQTTKPVISYDSMSGYRTNFFHNQGQTNGEKPNGYYLIATEKPEDRLLH